MNYIPEIAKMLGVEIGEEFKIEGHSGNVKYRLTEENLEYFSGGKGFTISSTLNKLLNGEYKVAKLPILDDIEKEYLSQVIKPFRTKILKIVKFENILSTNQEVICIIAKNGNISFPPFKKGTMYKGMKPEKEYTLEELGL